MHKSLLTAALFGLSLPLPKPSFVPRSTIWPRLLSALQNAGTVIITGPSGGGKTSLLRAAMPRLARCASAPLIHVDALAQAREPSEPLIETIPGPLAQALKTLSTAGLADARLLLTPVHHLSAGERARRVIALALHHSQGGVLIVDEFASNLDALTARGLAITLARAARRTNTALLIATLHPSLIPLFNAPLRIHCPLNGPIRAC